MIDLNEALTRQVADLARLELSESEVKTFTCQLGEILQYVDLLQKVPLPEGLEPLTHPLDLEPHLREDVLQAFPKDENGSPKILCSAPDVIDGGYKVPPVL